MAAGYQSLPQSRGKPFFFELNTDNAVYEGYHHEPPRGAARCCCCCIGGRGGSGGASSSGLSSVGRYQRCLLHCDTMSFKDWETESLYQQYAFAFRRALLCRLLLLHCLALAALTALDFALSHRRIAFKTIAYFCLLTVHLLLFVHVSCRLMRRTHMPVTLTLALLLVLLFAGVSLPIEWSFAPRATLKAASLQIEPERHYALPDGLWQTAFCVLTVYAFAPVRLFVALPFCAFLSAAHTAVASLLAKTPKLEAYYWRMFGTNVLVLVTVNLVGVLIHRGQERILRQIFMDTRDCITNRISYQEENDKLEQLCGVVAPEPLVSDLRRDFLHMCDPSRRGTGLSSAGGGGGGGGMALPSSGAASSGRFPLVINHLRNMSFLSCDMLPITQFPNDFPASEAVRLLNEVYGRLDQLAQEFSCFRVYMHSEQYFAVCGYPDTRMDHAKCCVEFAFAILELINNLSDSAELGIDVRVAVHTGDAFANLLGKTRLAYDLMGEDASIAKLLHSICSPGRVLVSKATFDQLPDGYRAESGPLLDAAPLPDARVVRVETYYIKPRHFRSSSNLRSGGGAPRRNRYTRLQALEAPQKRSGLVRITQCAKFNASAPYLFLAEDMQKQCVKLRDTDEFVRKPFKRKSTNAWTVSLQRYMALTVNGPSGDSETDESPLRSVRSLSMNPITLRFQDSYEEKLYHSNEDWTFGRSMVCALVLLLASAALQAVVLPRTILLLLLFMIAFTWIGMMLLVILVTKLRCLEFKVQSSAAVRVVVIVTSVLFIYAVSQVNVFCCRQVNNSTVSTTPTPPPRSTPGWGSYEAPGERSESSLLGPTTALVQSANHLSCDMPQYLPLSCLLSLLVLVGFMSLPAIGKLPLSLLIFASYAVVTEKTHKSLFDKYDHFVGRSGLPSHVQAMLCMALFVIFVYAQGRFMEYTMRLCHLWRSQARSNLEEAERMRHCSELVLKNILPEHVALYFLDNTYRNPIGLYSQEYNCLGVLCASLPTWQASSAANSGTSIHDDIRFLNDVIIQFDDLLQQEKFAPLDKVRALSNGYVAVVGVNPLCPLEDNASKMQYLTLLVQFAQVMKRTVEEANGQLGINRVKIRIGLHSGPGFCGVIGGQRPCFDLLGEAFQLAALLERTAGYQQIHVSSAVVTYTQAQYDYNEQGHLPLPSPAGAPARTLVSFTLRENGRGGGRLQTKRYSVPCNNAPLQGPPALPPHASGTHSMSRSAMRAIRQPPLSVAAPLPVLPSGGGGGGGSAAGSNIGTPPALHHSQQQQQQTMDDHPSLHNYQLPQPKPQPARHQQVAQGFRQPSAPHTPASDVAPCLPPRPSNPVGTAHSQDVAPPPPLVSCSSSSNALAVVPPLSSGPALSARSEASLNSFLQLENACSSPTPQQLEHQHLQQQQQQQQQQAQPAHHQPPLLQQQNSSPPDSPTEAFGGDHYNPLYTDNEYDTDMEAAMPSNGGPLRQSSLHSSPLPPGAGNAAAGGGAEGGMLLSGNLEAVSIFAPPSGVFTGVPMFGPGPSLGPAMAESPGVGHQLDFPDYKRPSSPGAPMGMLSRSSSGANNAMPPAANRRGFSPGGAVDSPREERLMAGPGMTLPLGGTLDSEATTHSRACEGPSLLFTLSDTGCGMRLTPAETAADRRLRHHVPGHETELEEVGESDLESTVDADGCATSVADGAACDSDLEAMRLQSDLASEDEHLFVSDLEDAIGERGLYRFPVGNRMSAVHQQLQQQQLRGVGQSDHHHLRDLRPATLPDVAPVGLPDFSLLGPGGSSNDEKGGREMEEDEKEEEAAAVAAAAERRQEEIRVGRDAHRHPREQAALERRRDRFKGRRVAAASPSVRSEYDNMCSESDAGYTGDVASSAYEEDSADDDSDFDLSCLGGPPGQRSLGSSDYDNMAAEAAAAAATAGLDVALFDERIAQEARRISHVFQQVQWNGGMETGTSAAEEDEEEPELAMAGGGEGAPAAPHEDGGESPMSLPPELTKPETLVALLGEHAPAAFLQPPSMTSSFSEVATHSEIGESEYDNYESDTANGELSSSSWFPGFALHPFDASNQPPSDAAPSSSGGGGGSHSRTTVV